MTHNFCFSQAFIFKCSFFCKHFIFFFVCLSVGATSNFVFASVARLPLTTLNRKALNFGCFYNSLFWHKYLLENSCNSQMFFTDLLEQKKKKIIFANLSSDLSPYFSEVKKKKTRNSSYFFGQILCIFDNKSEFIRFLHADLHIGICLSNFFTLIIKLCTAKKYLKPDTVEYAVFCTLKPKIC